MTIDVEYYNDTTVIKIKNYPESFSLMLANFLRREGQMVSASVDSGIQEIMQIELESASNKKKEESCFIINRLNYLIKQIDECVCSVENDVVSCNDNILLNVICHYIQTKCHYIAIHNKYYTRYNLQTISSMNLSNIFDYIPVTAHGVYAFKSSHGMLFASDITYVKSCGKAVATMIKEKYNNKFELTYDLPDCISVMGITGKCTTWIVITPMTYGQRQFLHKKLERYIKCTTKETCSFLLDLTKNETFYDVNVRECASSITLPKSTLIAIFAENEEVEGYLCTKENIPYHHDKYNYFRNLYVIENKMYYQNRIEDEKIHILPYIDQAKKLIIKDIELLIKKCDF